MRLRILFQVEFYYPYPDYKIPDCVISSEFLASGRAGELVSQMRSRDYSGHARVLWDEAATALELNRNGMLEFFSNSFLVLAGRNALKGVEFDQLGILFSSGRKPAYTTQARIVKGQVQGKFGLKSAGCMAMSPYEPAPLKLVETDSPWIDGVSVLTLVTLRALSRKRSIAEIFEPCRKWVELLVGESELQDGVRWIDGAHIDSIWANTYIIGDECRIIDREWVWNEKVRMNVVIIRAIYDFFCRIETSTLCSQALSASAAGLSSRISPLRLGERLTAEDFAEFIRIESEISWIVSGMSKSRQGFYIRWFLNHRPTRRFFRRVNPMVKDLLSRVKRGFRIWSEPVRMSLSDAAHAGAILRRGEDEGERFEKLCPPEILRVGGNFLKAGKHKALADQRFMAPKHVRRITSMIDNGLFKDFDGLQPDRRCMS